MNAILDREIKAYFQSPLGYLFVGVIFIFTGFFFYAYNLYGNTSDMRGIFNMLYTIILFLIPILTMRLLSEEKKQKTDQILLTSKASSFEIVIAKYLAAVCVYVMSLMSILFVAAVISILGEPEWAIIFGNFFGLLLFGMAIIAICMLVSSITESQLIAAVFGFSVSFLLVLLDTISHTISNLTLSKIVSAISFKTHYSSFTLGFLNVSDVVFFLSIIFAFISFTVLILEKRRIG